MKPDREKEVKVGEEMSEYACVSVGMALEREKAIDM